MICVKNYAYSTNAACCVFVVVPSTPSYFAVQVYMYIEKGRLGDTCFVESEYSYKMRRVTAVGHASSCATATSYIVQSSSKHV